MFCFQCQEAAKGTGCTLVGVCGKKESTSNLQDLLLFVTKGVSLVAIAAKKNTISGKNADKYIFKSLYITITNANFDDNKITDKILEGIDVRDALKNRLKEKGLELPADLPENANWHPKSRESIKEMSMLVGILTEKDEDIRSLKELLTYGLKGMAAYAEHAFNLGYTDEAIFEFIHKALVATTRNDITADELVDLTLEDGK